MQFDLLDDLFLFLFWLLHASSYIATAY